MYRMLVCLKIFFSENKKEELNFFKKEKRKKEKMQWRGQYMGWLPSKRNQWCEKKTAGKIYGMLQGCMSANNNNK